jgi:hypothetical protein
MLEYEVLREYLDSGGRNNRNSKKTAQWGVSYCCKVTYRTYRSSNTVRVILILYTCLAMFIHI